MDNDSAGRIVADLRRWVAQAPAGAQLPPSRELAARHGASPVTVQRAMRTLTSLGLVESRPGVGTFVRGRTTPAPVDTSWQTAALDAPPSTASLPATQRTVTAETIALHSSYPAPELLPEALVRSSLTRAARSAAAVTRTPSGGDPELQAWFAGQLAALGPDGASPPSARDVLVVPGTQSALLSIFRAVVGAGRALVVESPTYWGAILAARQAGVRLVPVPSGPAGPDPDEIAAALRRSGARAVYAQPTFANPGAAVWSPERRRAVLDVVQAQGAFLVEDDWARDLGIDEAPPPLATADTAGHVIYLRSLTKSVSPALRVGAVIARGPARERLLLDRTAESMYVSGVIQQAALDVVTRPAWRSHRRRVRRDLAARRDLLLEALATHAPTAHVPHVPAGGLNLWVRLPHGADADPVAAGCAARGVALAPGGEWFPAEATGPFVRLSYCGPDPDRYPEAARVIGEVLTSEVDALT